MIFLKFSLNIQASFCKEKCYFNINVHWVLFYTIDWTSINLKNSAFEIVFRSCLIVQVSLFFIWVQTFEKLLKKLVNGINFSYRFKKLTIFFYIKF